MILALLVSLAGGLGAVGRFMLDGALKSLTNRVAPVSTLIINLLGSLLFGICVGWAAVRGTDLSVLTTGFCGGFTTFSTAMVEAVTGLRAGRRGAAVALLIGMAVGCMLAVWIGIQIGLALA